MAVNAPIIAPKVKVGTNIPPVTPEHVAKINSKTLIARYKSNIYQIPSPCKSELIKECPDERHSDNLNPVTDVITKIAPIFKNNGIFLRNRFKNDVITVYSLVKKMAQTPQISPMTTADHINFIGIAFTVTESKKL